MPLLQDAFPAPFLDATRWTDTQQGTVSLTVGVPSDGVYPVDVDDHLDSVVVSSKGKIITPPNAPFVMDISYEGAFVDPEQDILSFLGWRSNQEYVPNEPAFGVDLILCVKPSGSVILQKRLIVGGVESISDIQNDPHDGAARAFRIERSGTSYLLWQWDGVSSWDLRDTVNLGYQGSGYIVFGQQALDPTLQAFPWISQT